MILVSRDEVNRRLKVLADYERGIVDGPERDPGLTQRQKDRHMVRAVAFEDAMRALLLVPAFEEERK